MIRVLEVLQNVVGYAHCGLHALRIPSAKEQFKHW